jgi:hypothetical protein
MIHRSSEGTSMTMTLTKNRPVRSASLEMTIGVNGRPKIHHVLADPHCFISAADAVYVVYSPRPDGG